MRFRTRSQEVEAIQYTGNNAAEVMRFCDTASAHSDGKGFEWIQVLTSDNERVSVYVGEYIRKSERGWVVQLREFFEARYEPVPDLIRTVEDYEGLPDGTILEVVEVAGQWLELGCIIVKRDDLEEPFALEQRTVTFTASHLVSVGTVCSVVRLGGDQWAARLF